MNTNKLKELMSEQQVNARKLAAQTEVSEGGISLILNGKRQCTLKTAVKIATALKMTQKDIISIFFGERK